MTSKLEIAPIEPEPNETTFMIDALGRIGQALEYWILQATKTLEPGDRDKALEMLDVIYSFSTLAMADDGDSSGVVSALVNLQESAFTLCERYPGLRSQLAALALPDANGAAADSSEVF